MDSLVENLINPMFGKPCCLKRVLPLMNGLALGFGKQIHHDNPKMIDSFYGEWEISNYYRSWRVMGKGRILCGSQDPSSHEELTSALNKIDFGRIVGVSELTLIDFRVQFDNGIDVDFLSTISEDDETLCIFCPEHMCAIFSVANGWKIAPSNQGTTLHSRPGMGKIL